MNKPTYEATTFSVYPTGYHEFSESGIRGSADVYAYILLVTNPGRGWAIRQGSRCWNRVEKCFEYETQPSNRDEEFFATYRFDDFDEAMYHALKIVDEYQGIWGKNFAEWIEYCYNDSEKL